MQRFKKRERGSLNYRLAWAAVRNYDVPIIPAVECFDHIETENTTHIHRLLSD